MNIMLFLTPKDETVFEPLDATLKDVLDRMERHRLTAIPVIDSHGRYVGTLTEGDILRVIKTQPFQSYASLSSLIIEDIPRMTKHRPVNVQAEFDKLVSLAMGQNFVPVVDDAKTYIGIVKRSDIIQHCYQTMINKPEHRAL
ncbi:hypothetical protein ABB02_00452 [Clostridiaceae bacterium JG1575]|nr:hypothetical protein ABB02_00452 [Clostridiaceae bacterium JG1575]